MFARSYAVMVLRGYEKVIAAIKGVAVIKEFDRKLREAAGAMSERRRGKSASKLCFRHVFNFLGSNWCFK